MRPEEILVSGMFSGEPSSMSALVQFERVCPSRPNGSGGLHIRLPSHVTSDHDHARDPAVLSGGHWNNGLVWT